MRALHRALFERSGDGFWRRLLVALTLAAFVQQGLVTQAHIHVAAATAPQPVAGTLGGHGTGPVRDDPSQCPLCQEFVLAGAYLAPAAIVIPPPALALFHVTRPAPQAPHVDATSHAWLGRGPPQG